MGSLEVALRSIMRGSVEGLALALKIATFAAIDAAAQLSFVDLEWPTEEQK